MITYQDFEKRQSTEKFIKDAIEVFKQGEGYKIAVEANNYYKSKNTGILKRMMWFYDSLGLPQEDKFKANNKICSEFFRKILCQENSYLLGNGVITDETIKEDLGGNKFDIKLQMFGLTSLIEGVTWGYCFINEKGKFTIEEFKGKELIPLYDERTGVLRAAIRFFSVGDSKGITIELYEEDGKTEYYFNKNEFKEITPKQAYRIKKQVDALETKVVESRNWSKLPLIPLYANELKESEFTTGLKSKIDVYDLVNSDLANNLEDNKDIIYMLKNYGGEGIGDFLADLKMYNVVNVDEDGGFDTKQPEVPHEARKLALESLRKSIYSDAMALDVDSIRGGSLTNVAIKAAMIDLDLKTDKFEWQVISFLESVIDLYQEYRGMSKDVDIKFIRRNIVNDTEIIENIYKCREDISRETALKLNPYVEDVEAEMELLEVEARNNVKIPLVTPPGPGSEE